VILGRDGYRALLALGEIAPEFEAKQLIFAERKDGKRPDAGHLRLVVPLDKRGGRTVREVVRIEITRRLPLNSPFEGQPKWSARMRYGRPS